MFKSSKFFTVTLILLIANSQELQCSNPSHWQMFITFIFGETQPRSNTDQAPDNVTIDNYIAQFRSDLNGHTGAIIIPLDEVQEMETILRTELRSCNLQNTDMVNQKIRSVIINQVKEGTISDLNELKSETYYSNQFFIISQDYQTIPNSYENNIIARLNKTPHLSGYAIAQYFGETRKNEIRDSLIKRGPKVTNYY